ncbi:tetratricopeptide repeat protein [Olleya aquimaris]|uniref:Tetratricopeptide repeat protein n=1 Tax=Olleya aquimaris TaxID=639310 RepID=A0A327RM37_9FLAO|nr:tetratricopeptide repeat protein [Olleya aquimaris]RAJ18076.1 tetratricopeptide repeat protein [Olleya aquimaris]
MKTIFLFLTTFFSVTIAISQTEMNTEVIDDKGNAKLLGPINKEGLQNNTYKDWFNKNYNDYIVNEKLVETFKDSLKDYKIKVFLGTWCGDSKQEVPRFYNVLETANFNLDNLEVIALDNEKTHYKQGPNGEEKGYNIHRVPTFIFYKDNKEVSRIVEHPVETLERDIEKIVTNQRYTFNYIAANYIQYLLAEKTIEELQNEEKILVAQLSEFVKGSRELNTLGYVYLRAKNYEKAIYTFKLNTLIFPYKHNVYDSLGEAYFENKNYLEATKNYNKVLELNPEDENALDMLKKIKLVTKE